MIRLQVYIVLVCFTVLVLGGHFFSVDIAVTQNGLRSLM
jgi:hypothetical protein